MNVTERHYPMSKPQGHVPAVQRFSSVVPAGVSKIQVLVVGMQSKHAGAEQGAEFRGAIQALIGHDDGPANADYASFTDPQGYANVFAVCYWDDCDAFGRWREGYLDWWHTLDPATIDNGYWAEAFQVPVQHRETIAFKEYIRGLSACPMASIEAMNESGYWGAARDRIAGSACDRFEVAADAELCETPGRTTEKRRIRIMAPKNMAVIRSGVSWKDCGEEQLASYDKNIRPKLDAGMEYLRTNPRETGCASLRQVQCITPGGGATKEAYSLGYFLSLGHLEDWSREHPTHLAIFHRAQAERQKYKERLELRTYHEVYVLGEDSTFEYVNCHNRTGLLPYFSVAATSA